jgi:hypothetical protein
LQLEEGVSAYKVKKKEVSISPILPVCGGEYNIKVTRAGGGGGGQTQR